MARAQGALLVFSFVLVTAAAACGGAADTTAGSQNAANAASDEDSPSGEPRDVAAIHRSRCGNCHVRVEPGERTRAELETALARHHKRVKMSDAEWSRMIDYLAKK